MKVRLVSGGTARVLELDDISQIVVHTDQGDACLAAHETNERVVIAGHAGEKDFQQLLAKLGIRRAPTVELLGG